MGPPSPDSPPSLPSTIHHLPILHHLSHSPPQTHPSFSSASASLLHTTTSDTLPRHPHHLAAPDLRHRSHRRPHLRRHPAHAASASTCCAPPCSATPSSPPPQ